MPVSTIALITMAASALGGLGMGIANAVGAPSPPIAPTAQQLAAKQAKEAEAAAQAQATQLMKRQGMASTMLTSPMGTSTPGSTQRATLGT